MLLLFKNVIYVCLRFPQSSVEFPNHFYYIVFWNPLIPATICIAQNPFRLNFLL